MKKLSMCISLVMMIHLVSWHAGYCEIKIPDEKDLADRKNRGKCFDGDCKNGQGTFIHSEDSWYSGVWKNGKYHGKGQLTRNTGRNPDVYVGEFQDGEFHGKGTLLRRDGVRIEGNWVKGYVVREGQPIKKELKPAWVKAKGGLRMRNKPSTDGELIIVIPEREEVRINEESGDILTISGSKGRWTRVEYEDKSGWVFGGFLTGEQPDYRGVFPLMDEFAGLWIRLESRDNTYFIIKSAGREEPYCYPVMEISYNHQHYPDTPILVISTIMDSSLFWIDNVIRTDGGVRFRARSYSYTNKKPDGKTIRIDLKYIDGTKRANVTFPDGPYSEMIFIRGAFSSEVETRTLGPEH